MRPSGTDSQPLCPGSQLADITSTTFYRPHNVPGPADPRAESNPVSGWVALQSHCRARGQEEQSIEATLRCPLPTGGGILVAVTKLHCCGVGSKQLLGPQTHHEGVGVLPTYTQGSCL